MAEETLVQSRFLTFLGKPSDQVLCGLMNLQTAVTWVIAFDILLALLYTLESVMLILLNGLIASEFVEITVSLVANCVSILALPFAVVGLMGLRQGDWDKFHVYFLYKCFETFFICIYSPATSFLYCDDTGYLCEVVTLIAILVQKVGVDLYFTYVVWSADYLLKGGMLQKLSYARNVEMMKIPKATGSLGE